MSETDRICTAKHAPFQPTEHWKWQCPECYADPEFIVALKKVGGAGPDCRMVHSADKYRCEKCRATWTGEALSKIMMEERDRKPCLTCKGLGHVPVFTRTRKKKGDAE